MAGSVSFGGVELSQILGADLTVTRLDGWWDAPEPRYEGVERMGVGGDFPAPVYDQPRFVELALNVNASDHDALHRAGLAWTGLFRRGLVQMRVAGHGPTTWAMVHRESASRFSTITDTLAVASVTLKAPDPYRYSITQRYWDSMVGTRVAVSHQGNAEGYPEVAINGSFPEGFNLWVSDGTTGVDGPENWAITYMNPVTAQQEVRIDLRTGLVRVNGQQAPGGSLGRAQLSYVPAGVTRYVNVLKRGGAAVSGDFQVRLYDHYI